MSSEYWIVTVEAALDECGLTATIEQVEAMAKVIESSHDGYSEFSGECCAATPSKASEPKPELIQCYVCKGNGYTKFSLGAHGTWVAQYCDKCSGQGYTTKHVD
ncbi:MAG: hypothetical protein GY820_33355 [Gammaproteobacteria bacterium]|nr:hypothetical protein [Bacteroidota bacterium]MCP4492159.1 hypothetical protein [Gammaproteobacteria bacterium]